MVRDAVIGSGEQLATPSRTDSGNEAFALKFHWKQGWREQLQQVLDVAAVQHQHASLRGHRPSNPFQKAKIAAWLANFADAFEDSGLHGTLRSGA